METISTAAIKVGDKIYSVPRPGRHDAIFRLIFKENPGTGPIIGANQGFLTSTGRFVDRFEAGLIAINAQQIKTHPNTASHGPAELNWPDELYSEDLW